MLIFSSRDYTLDTVTLLQSEDIKMRSSSSCAAAAALENNLSETLSILEDHRIPQGCPQSVSDPPIRYIRAGILRYNRESDNPGINLTTIPPAPLTEYQVKCEYCGEKAQPSLDPRWAQGPEPGSLFCCAQQQWLYEMLEKERCLLERRCDLRCDVTATTSPADEPATEMEELPFQGKEMEDHNNELPHGLGEQSEPRIDEDHSTQLPVAETCAPTSKVCSFRLSCAPEKGCWTVYPWSATEKHMKIQQEEAMCRSLCLTTSPFGICHHQGGAESLQKFYSTGMKFLTVFPNGSAQVFYPSGLLALIVVVTEENGRVCIVFDDSSASCQPIRAVFESDGRATCYHSNGNIWLILNSSGGQCLDEVGAKVRQWGWGSLSLPSSPLHPVFLSLNKTVGVRVLGREKVYVSFLARGQQARFSVGSCCAQSDCKTDRAASGPAVLKEELFVSAARIRIHLAIQQLHQCLKTPSQPWLLKTSQSPHLHVVAQRLLKVSADVMMSESERAFIHMCLQDCL